MTVNLSSKAMHRQLSAKFHSTGALQFVIRLIQTEKNIYIFFLTSQGRRLLKVKSSVILNDGCLLS